jgi:hypothetical protein
MLCHVDLVRTDISEEHSASIIGVTRIGELGTRFLCSVCRLLVTANVVPSSQILVTQAMQVLCFTEMLVLTRSTWHNVPEYGILHIHCCENLKSTLFYESSQSVWQSVFLHNFKNVTNDVTTMK